MASIFTKGITKIFGSKSDKDIKAIMPFVNQTNEVYQTLAELSNDQLREKTNELREKINSELKSIDDQIAELHRKVDEDPSLNIHTKDDIFKQIDALEEVRNEELEKVLIDILPEAFAIVKDTARRFKENETIEVTATVHDKQYALVGEVSKNILQLGDEVYVKVKNADLVKKQLDFTYLRKKE